jgi:hypothetical protein
VRFGESTSRAVDGHKFKRSLLRDGHHHLL